MNLLIKNKWYNILDSYLLSNSIRIRIQAIFNLERIDNQYFIRKKSLRNLYNYYREIGFKSVVQKGLSRLRENARNEKYFSIGIGEILESSSNLFSVKQMVCFIAPNHSACVERIVIHEKLAFTISQKDYTWLSKDHIIWCRQYDQQKWWGSFFAWSPYSGLPVSSITNAIHEKMIEILQSIPTHEKKYIVIKTPSIVSEVQSTKKIFSISSIRKTAALFGYGNYAKTMLLPNLNKKIKITTIHEIDPTQLIPSQKNIYYDTCPYPRPNSKQDVYFIAGYHHTHADIAITGLKNNIDVVVEKPLMTTYLELENVILALQQSSAKYYACFQRRYHRFNDYMLEDFQIMKGDPISYFAVIYEESLPEFHWYRWPNSCSAIISNGCHWIDHFLFLNNFSPVLTSFAHKTKNNDIVTIVTLENNATLSLTLSHTGSSRIGMQEYIELRSGKNTAKINNGNYYCAENSARIIRRAKINKYESYKKMYQNISNSIIEKNNLELHDTWEKIKMVSSLILSLDEYVR